MKLDRYIKKILDQSPNGVDINFELNIECTEYECFVVDWDTGNKVSFTVCNIKENKNEK